VKGLSTLIRLADAEVTERQRALAEIGRRVDALLMEAAAHEAAIEAEAAAVREAADPRMPFGAYVQAALLTRADLERRRIVLDAEAEQIRAGLNEAFVELKRLQLLAEKLQLRERAEEEARDRASIDEVATSRFARRG